MDIELANFSAINKDQNICRSMDGISAKIHLAVDSNAHPIEFLISDGRTHAVQATPNLVDALNLESTEVL